MFDLRSLAGAITYFSTTCFTVFDVLGVKSKSPPYSALMADLPLRSPDVVMLAEPPLNVPVPRKKSVWYVNVTVSPSGGGPALEVTTAVKVTGSP